MQRLRIVSWDLEYTSSEVLEAQVQVIRLALEHRGWKLFAAQGSKGRFIFNCRRTIAIEVEICNPFVEPVYWVIVTPRSLRNVIFKRPSVQREHDDVVDVIQAAVTESGIARSVERGPPPLPPQPWGVKY